MGVDYETSIGLGRQAPIDYTQFPYDRYYALEEECTKHPWLCVRLIAQEYKGEECHTTLFVGKDLPRTHRYPTHGKAIDIATVLDDVEKADLTQAEMVELDQVCGRLQEALQLAAFGDYGVHVLVHCF